MDIDRRKSSCILRTPAIVYFCCLLFIFSRVSVTFGSTLYFTNNSSIDRLVNKTITSVIEAESEIKALDCNSCDDRIYWTNGKDIKRSFPNETSSIESVLSYGVTEPVGVAVDWRGNNVYFTDQITDDYASVEVVTCDGKYRRILFRNNDQLQYQSAGPIVVDSLHGYIFFADVYCCIHRANMDGSGLVQIVAISEGIITDLALHYDSSTLYWVHNDQINSCDYNGNNKSSIPSSVINGTIPHSVIIDNGVLYWTQKKSIEEEGAIYSYSLNGEDSSMPVTPSDNSASPLDPYDISATVSKQVVASALSGCSVQNGQCNHFCFTMPNSTHPSAISSNVKCSCRTGFAFKAGSNTTCVNSPVKFLLAGQGSSISLLSFDIPGEEYLLSLPISSDGSIDYITYDRSNFLVYWTQRDPPAIWQSDLNGDNCRPLITTNIALPEGLVVSDSGANLYWADSILDKIEVVSLYEGGFARRTLIDFELDHPIGLTINESTGYIYWTDIGITHYGVEEAAKDGSHRRQIQCTDTCHHPGPITVDSSTGDVYFADKTQDHLLYYTPTPDHSGIARKSTIDVEQQHVAGLTILNNEVFWTDRIDGIVYKEDLSPSNDIKDGIPVANHLGQIRDITSVDNELNIVSTPCSNNNGGCAEICVTTQGGSDKECLCKENFIPKGTNCVEEQTATIVYSTPTEMKVFQVSPTVALQTTVPASAQSMDIDYVNQDLYFIGNNDNVIYKTYINISSSDLNHTITPLTSCCYGNLSDIAVDWWGRNLYYSDSLTGTIWVSKMDGTNRQVLLKDLDTPTHIALDPYESTLYYVERGLHVRSVYMNGNQSPSLSIPATDLPIKDLYVSVSDHTLYWLSDEEIYSYDLRAGSNNGVLVQVVPEVSFLVGQLDNLLYFYPFSAGVSQAFNVDSRLVDFGFILGSIPLTTTSFVLNHYSTQPDTHWCSRTNGDCRDSSGPEPLCFVSDYYSRTCRCDPTEYLLYDYDEDRNVCRSMCLGAPPFVLLSTNSDIFHLSVREPGISNDDQCGKFTPTANELPLVDMGVIQAIAYDPDQKRIFWADGSSQAGHSISSDTLRGEDRQVLGSYAQLDAVSMGYDWKGGNLIWTEDHATKISFISESGQGSGVIYESPVNYSSPANYWEPVQVAVDWTESVVYWSNSANFSLNKLSLVSLSTSYVHVPDYDDHSKPRKLQIRLLAIEPHEQFLFWYNVFDNSIEQYNIDTQNLSKIVQVGKSDEITAMAATTAYGHVCLFWYNQSDWSVYYYNMSSTEIIKHSTMKKYTKIVSMAAYDEDQYSVLADERQCITGERPCSHVCSTVQSTVQCQCPLYRTLEDEICSDPQCDDINLMTCDDNSTCYSEAEKCDGIKNCDDASDELGCPNGCSKGDTHCPTTSLTDMCVSITKLCSGGCPGDLDAARCTCDSNYFFRCESIVDDVEIVKCVPNALKCDESFNCPNVDCNSRSTSSSTSVTTSPSSQPTQPSVPPSEPPTADFNSIIVSVSAVIGVIALMTAIGVCAIMARCFIMARRSKDIDIRHEGYSLKTTSSPQHSPTVRSICTSDLSINTMVTGSTNVDKTSQEARLIKRLSTLSTDPSNPPNSPITRRSVAFTMGDEVTISSEFDPPIPPPPNPSVDYDVISEGITSVSQRKFPGVIPSNGFPPRIDEHSESPPPPYFNQPHPIYEEDSVDIAPYKDFCPPIIPHHLTEMAQLDDISQATFSTISTATELLSDNHYHHHHGFHSLYDPHNNSEQQSCITDSTAPRDDGTHIEAGEIHPYDRPPPPSPVTVYSIQGD